MQTTEHMRYLGVLKLLEECSPYVPEQLREQIEYAMTDAVEASEGQLRTRRTFNRIEIEAVR